KMDVLEIGFPYAKELLFQRLALAPGDASGAMMKSLLRMQAFAQEVPTQLSQILMDLEGGKFRVHMEARQVDKLTRVIYAATMTLVLAICAGTLGLGGLVIFSRYPLEWHGLPVLGVIALGLAAAFLSSAVTWYLLAHRVKKLSLRHWLRR